MNCYLGSGSLFHYQASNANAHTHRRTLNSVSADTSLLDQKVIVVLHSSATRGMR